MTFSDPFSHTIGYIAKKEARQWGIACMVPEVFMQGKFKTGDHPEKPVGGRQKEGIIHVSYRLEGGKSVTDSDYYSQLAGFVKVGICLPETSRGVALSAPRATWLLFSQAQKDNDRYRVL
jgi:hypothetical protein